MREGDYPIPRGAMTMTKEILLNGKPGPYLMDDKHIWRKDGQPVRLIDGGKPRPKRPAFEVVR